MLEDTVNFRSPCIWQVEFNVAWSRRRYTHRHMSQHNGQIKQQKLDKIDRGEIIDIVNLISNHILYFMLKSHIEYTQHIAI